MKRVLTNVTFSKSARTVTFSGLTTVVLERILAVVDVTRGVIVYNPADPARTGTVATNVLTLAHDTTGAGFADTDRLLVVYELADGIDRHTSATGTLTPNTVTTQALTASGWTPVELEVTNVDGAGRLYVTLDGTNPTASNFLAVLPATPSSVVLPVSGASVSLRLWSFNSAIPTWAATLRGTT